jgi:hypothetical protein
MLSFTSARTSGFVCSLSLVALFTTYDESSIPPLPTGTRIEVDVLSKRPVGYEMAVYSKPPSLDCKLLAVQTREAEPGWMTIRVF